ncbi:MULTISPECIES: hypothetical protein [unclassified Streptomyces]|uniref:hypothetical protein n=1 Tax=unclassified Streptomyces TaxID=2593676 RepID=UPI000700467E|nr:MULTISPECIES: hypothetical protein [unclassified Streptomyces]KQX50812.1 hypothetical protein ASD33_12310 [Streptomyces sp. Root1304]KRA84977.1 hypothetical protein ASE09_12315 [Streptomyces sp. Root66D1]
MALEEGQRVRLATDLRLTGAVTRADGPVTSDEPEADAGAAEAAFAGFLALAAGLEGVVERVDTHEKRPNDAAREYERLKSLLDDFGHQMPPGSRSRLEEKIVALEPEWTAYQRERTRVTVRVRFGNGFVLDEAPEDVLTVA